LQQPAAEFAAGIEFQVEVTAPSHDIPAIKGAISAWLVFGGVGSRTRRGCGALMVTEHEQRRNYLPPSPSIADGAATRTWLEKLVFAGGCGPDWTKLDGAGVICDKPGAYSPLAVDEIWKDLGYFWSRIRKLHIDGQDYKPVGKTLWPDHRRLSEIRGREAKLVLGKAYLGLPIIYQQGRGFKGELKPDKDRHGGGRAASPVILKPLMYADGTVSAMVAVLRTPIVKLKHLKAGDNMNIEVSPSMQGQKHPLNVVLDAADHSKDNAILQGNLLQIRGKRTNV
jgi:CRISPR-associated protein Cmr1